MDCRKFQKNLEDYLEGGLDFPGRFGIERHAQQCFGCGHELADAQKLDLMARELTRVSAPPDFEAEVLNRIHTRGGRSRFWSLRSFWIYGFDYASWRFVALGASALALLGFGILLSTFWVSHNHQTPASLVSSTPTPVLSSRENAVFDPALSNFRPPASDNSANAKNIAPVKLSPSLKRGGFSIEGDGFAGQIEPSEYEDYLVPGPGDRQMVVRLPKTIRIRYGQPSEDYYIRNVSH